LGRVIGPGRNISQIKRKFPNKNNFCLILDLVLPR